MNPRIQEVKEDGGGAAPRSYFLDFVTSSDSLNSERLKGSEIEST
jgi:hypothetical protein